MTEICGELDRYAGYFFKPNVEVAESTDSGVFDIVPLLFHSLVDFV